MVRFVVTLVCGALVVCACRSDLDFPPRLVTGPVSDTAGLIPALPDSGAVHIGKNGYRAFDLGAIVADEDDADSTITWSLTPGPALEVRLYSDTARIGPVPNQVCTSYVVFTATDPGGLNTSRTCPISVFEFLIHLDSVVMDPNSVRQTVIDYDYRPDLRAGLTWDQPVCDPAWLPQCSLTDSSGAKILRLTTGDSVGTTGIYLRVNDPANHVDFHHSIQVTIE
ncbi:hypothetical protein FJY68_07685 [candidate division WOR-3 bacterium]|uniref:Uncharacterized protein n=1 Tax=candidate division WOR-3 bacterium TaxID=2052148 RepID=A0A937XG04_UNCW3|nr:hypothetical protein [candidate division WOR-3 bacterium]